MTNSPSWLRGEIDPEGEGKKRQIRLEVEGNLQRGQVESVNIPMPQQLKQRFEACIQGPISTGILLLAADKLSALIEAGEKQTMYVDVWRDQMLER